MLNNEEMLQGLAQLGAHFTPTHFRGKNPHANNWQEKPVPYEDLKIMMNGETPINVSILLGKYSNGIVDIDLDSPSAIYLASEWLPDTGLVFGRASTRGAHRLYRIEGSENTKTKPFDNPTLKHRILEFRSTGGYTVIPPSTHEEGELIEWDRTEGITEVDYEDLIIACQRLAVACMWAERWELMVKNRQTHTTNIALAGALARSGVPEDITYKIVESGCIFFGETREGADIQLRAVTDTYKNYEKWKAGESSDPVTGWPTLGELLEQKEMRFIREMLMIAEPETVFERSDTYNAGILVREHGDNMRFHVEEQMWYIWNGQYWEKDAGKSAIRLGSTIGAVIEREMKEAPPDKHKAMKAAAVAARNHGKIVSMLRIAESEPKLHIRSYDENPDPFKLNVLNGTLDLRTGSIEKHDRNDNITKIGQVRFDPEAVGEKFHTFLDNVLPDRELQRWVQKAWGYSALGLTDEEVYFMPFGTGQNGKGTLANIMAKIFGNYCQQARVTTFLAQRGTDNIRQDLAEMASARIVLASEPAEGNALDPSIIKDVTGGDLIRSRFLYGREFQYTPKFALWMSANHKPKTSAFDPAIWRRVRVVPFVVQIPMEARDEGLKKFLSTDEENLSAALNWVLAGTKMWFQERLGSCRAVDEANAQYKYESNTVAQFLEDFCDITGDSKDFLPKVRLMSHYNEWAKTSNLRSVKRAQFEQALHDTPGVTESRDGKSWVGLKPNSSAATNNAFSALFAVNK